MIFTRFFSCIFVIVTNTTSQFHKLIHFVHSFQLPFVSSQFFNSHALVCGIFFFNENINVSRSIVFHLLNFIIIICCCCSCNLFVKVASWILWLLQLFQFLCVFPFCSLCCFFGLERTYNNIEHIYIHFNRVSRNSKAHTISYKHKY